MIVYGRNPVREALRGRRDVFRVWATKNAAREHWLATSSVPVTVTLAEEIARRSETDAHQGVCAEMDEYGYVESSAVLVAPDPLIVALDQVQDPHNLGAICRSAECAGATAVVIPERRSAEVTPAVCKASAGAVEHLPIARVRNIADFLAEAKTAGVWCYGAEQGAPLAYDQVDFAGGVALVLGGEGKGVRPRVASACDALVS
ncbi:MAG: RNA methyltransferase, partial [Actinomycetota bacterium]|nr:RNA methyltransferase [Actinomycetota bacterium]